MKHIIIASTKGGVGKTTVAVNIARKLSTRYKVGILDGDLTSPSIYKILNAPVVKLKVGRDKIEPTTFANMKLFSTALLTGDDDMPILFKGEKKRSTIEQFINKINWGDLDYLIIDAAPGCSDELIELLEIFKNKIDGMVIVSTPSRLSVNSVRKLVTLCQKKSVPIVGIVSNMAYFDCNVCHSHNLVFGNSYFIGQTVNEFDVDILCMLPISMKVEDKPFSIIHNFNWVFEVL
jgi:ATP-binding protein involved in chromosome partitioning